MNAEVELSLGLPGQIPRRFVYKLLFLFNAEEKFWTSGAQIHEASNNNSCKNNTHTKCLPSVYYFTLILHPISLRKSAYDVFGGVIPPNQQQKIAEPEKQSSSRRSSFRIPVQDDFEKDESPSPDNGPTLLIDDDRRIRRRGSQL